MNDANEQDLLARLRRRDERAFNELVRRCERDVYDVALGILGDRARAQDAAQEAFVEAFRTVDQCPADASVTAWTLALAARVCHGIAARSR
jgi:RNA polymerase sigma-70 factor (ECF subfamily)